MVIRVGTFITNFRVLKILPNQDLCHILVKMSKFWIFFAFSIVKGLSEHVVKILALKFEPKKVMPKRPNFH